MKGNVKKQRFLAIFLGAFIALTAAIGILAAPVKRANATDWASAPQTLQFKQVAAGEDFAIALTYDNRLFAWSLNADQEAIDGSATTLGGYYPSKPIQIEYSLTGIKVNTTHPYAVGIGDNTAGSHAIGYDGDEIASIAATRTTAAFITKAGLVYVWGRDCTEKSKYNGEASSSDRRMHLNMNTNVFVTAPTIIDYNSAASLKDIVPYGKFDSGEDYTGSPFARSIVSLSASAYNYMVTAVNGNGETINYVWGDHSYGLTFKDNSVYAYDYSSSEYGATVYSGALAYLGDGNVYYLDGSSLKVKGKNYILPSGKKYTDFATTTDGLLTNNTAFAGYNTFVDGASQKASMGFLTHSSSTYYYIQNAITKGFQTIDGTAGSLTAPVADFENADGTAAVTGVPLTSFSASNGYGYMISGTKLYFWGDTTLGQHNGAKAGSNSATSARLAELTGISSPKQVVAGKIKAGASPFIGFGYGDYETAEVITEYERWESSGTDADKFTAAYCDDNTYITGVLTSENKVYAFGAYNGTAKNASSVAVDFTAYGISSGSTSTDKIVALYGGYGNNLFAVSSLGRIFRIFFNVSGDLTYTVYNDFLQTNGTEFTKTTVYSTARAEVTVDIADNYRNAPQKATVVVKAGDGVVSTSTGGKINGRTDSVTLKGNQSVVSSNRGGFAYRMVIPTDTGVGNAVKDYDDLLIDFYDNGGSYSYNPFAFYEYTHNASYDPEDSDSKEFTAAPKIDSASNKNFLVSNDKSYKNITSGENVTDADFDNSLKFYWSDSWSGTDYTDPITDIDIAFRYIDIEYRYFKAYDDNNGDIDFVITPKRATPKTASGDHRYLVIEYPIAAYDTVNGIGSVTASSAVPCFYDVYRTRIAIKIGDTALTPVFMSSKGVKPDGDTAADHTDSSYNGINGNSLIPLLDANNDYNNQYSIAAMNVNEGFNVLFTALSAGGFKNYNTSPTGASFAAFDTNANFYKQVYEADGGFPASSKVAASAGDLKYYFTDEDADAYFNNRYLYFAKDIDGDVLKVDAINNQNVTVAQVVTVTDNGKELYTCSSEKITLRFKLFSSVPATSDANLVKLKKLLGLNEDVHVSEFDNMYGFEFEIKEDTLFVSYSVLRLTAKGSMDNVTYTDNDIRKPVTEIAKASVANEKVTIGNTLYAAYQPVNVKLNGYNISSTEETWENAVNGKVYHNRSVIVYTQSSLRLKNGEVYGKNGNNYFIVPDAITLNSETQAIANVDLTKYISDYEKTEFSYNGTSGNDDIANWRKSFGNARSAVEIVEGSVDSSTLSFKIKANNVAKAKFVVELRRYAAKAAESKTDKKLTYSDDDTEIVYFEYSVVVNEPERSGFSNKDSGNLSQVINNNTPINGVYTLNITDRLNVSDSVLARKNVKVSSSNEAVATVELVNNGTAVKITPKVSGTAWIRISVGLFENDNSRVISDSFMVKVATLVSYPQINVISEEEIQFSDLVLALRRANSEISSNTVISPHIVEGEELYYLQEYDVARDDEGDIIYEDEAQTKPIKEWKTLSGKISFISEIYTNTNNTAIGIIADSYDSVDNPPEVRIVVKFDADNGNRYEVAIPVSPASLTLHDVYDGAELADKGLMIQITKDSGVASVVHRTVENGEIINSEEVGTGIVKQPDGSFRIMLDFLINDKKMYDYSSAKKYYVQAVQAQSINGAKDYGKYITVTPNSATEADSILVTPLYPTAELGEGEGCNIQVSIYEKSSGEVRILNFTLRVNGIKTTLEKEEYEKIIIASFFGVLGFLVIIFFIRLGVYWKKKADQRRIIKKNQTLIKMRDKMHSRSDAANKEKLVRTKLKMEDPKYAKMFNQLRQDKEAETGISLENSVVADKAENREKAAKAAKKKKKGSRSSIEELQAQLQAKREAVARMQMGDFSNIETQSVPAESTEETPADIPVFDPSAGFDGMSTEQLDEQFRQAMAGSDDIVFEAMPEDNSNQ